MIHEGFDTELDFRLSLFPGVSAHRVVHEFGSWLCDAFTATEAARERLREWTRLGCPKLGDELRGMAGKAGWNILRKAQIVLRQLPQPVGWYVSTHCYVVAFGPSSNPGWCESFPVVISARILTISNPTDRLILHEYSHAWLHGDDKKPRDELVFVKRDKARQGMELLAAGRLVDGDGVLYEDEYMQKIAVKFLEDKDVDEKKMEREAEALESAWLAMIRKQRSVGNESRNCYPK